PSQSPSRPGCPAMEVGGGKEGLGRAVRSPLHRRGFGPEGARYPDPLRPRCLRPRTDHLADRGRPGRRDGTPGRRDRGGLLSGGRGRCVPPLCRRSAPLLPGSVHPPIAARRTTVFLRSRTKGVTTMDSDLQRLIGKLRGALGSPVHLRPEGAKGIEGALRFPLRRPREGKTVWLEVEGPLSPREVSLVRLLLAEWERERGDGPEDNPLVRWLKDSEEKNNPLEPPPAVERLPWERRVP